MRRIAFFTDIHLGQQVHLSRDEKGVQAFTYQAHGNTHVEELKIVLSDIVKRGITDVVFGGDIGLKSSNALFFELLATYGLQPKFILGNHDDLAEVSHYWSTDLFVHGGELLYVEEDDAFRYLYLDTSSNAISDQQLNWVKGNLDSSRKLIVFVHHPILAIHTPIDSLGAALKGRNELRKLLLDFQQESTIFCGHYHMEDLAVEQHIKQYTTLASSYQIEKMADEMQMNEQVFGYSILTIENAQVSRSLVTFTRD